MKHCDIINKIMKYRKLSVAELSRISGVKQQTLYTILRQQQETTSERIYIPICSSTKFPVKFFTEENVIEEDIDFYFIDEKEDSYLFERFNQNNITYEYIYNGFQYIGNVEYSLDDIKSFIVNDNPPPDAFGIIDNIIMSGKIISIDEYHLIEMYRTFDDKTRNFVKEFLLRMMESETYRNNKEIDSEKK